MGGLTASSLFAVLALLGFSNGVIVEVPGYATVRGGIMESYLQDNPIYSFFGLRYAKPPTPETRFQPAEPIGQYPEGTLINATFYGPRCLQGGDGQEDCLLLNVFTRELPNATNPNPNIPVMFWIHGGSFTSGESLIYSPFALLDKRVVLVVIQYRLGPQGWLYLGNDDIPGNAGLYDMIEALRWVQMHISAFGGDPNSVTIFGESAGGASVGLLMLCKPAQGLFHRVIGQSGSAMVPWALDEDPIPHTLRIAELAGCPLEPQAEMVSCLKNMDQHELSRAQRRHTHEERLNGGLGFGGASAVVQMPGGLFEPLILDQPSVLLETGDYINDVPVMFGVNKHEGTFVLGTIWGDNLEPLNRTDDYEFLKTDLVPMLVSAIFGRPATPEEIQFCYDFFLPGVELGYFDKMMPGLVDMTGVLFLKQGAYDTVRLHHKFQPQSYLYAFNYAGRFSLFPFLIGNIPEIPHGVTHADELLYIYSLLPVLFNETEEYMTTRMVELWTNFAIYGNPTPDGVELSEGLVPWPAYSDANPFWMALDQQFTASLDYTTTFTVARDENFGSQERISIDISEYLEFIPEGDENYRFIRKSDYLDDE